MPIDESLFPWLPPATWTDDHLANSLGPLNERIHAFRALSRFASFDLDFVQTAALDDRTQSLLEKGPIEGVPTVRLALLSTATLTHAIPSLRVGGLRRGLLITIYEGDIGQIRQEVLTPDSQLSQFSPDVVFFAVHHEDFLHEFPLDSDAEKVQAHIRDDVNEWVNLWKACKERFGASVVHQLAMAPPWRLFGNLDLTASAAPDSQILEINRCLRESASGENVNLFDPEAPARRVGLNRWYAPALWFHAKQKFSPLVAPLYGDALAQVMAAIRGLSKKCLVVDLDNTLWGGVIGDDGLQGIGIGQGDAVGEAFLAFQRYLKSLRRGGVLLAVCSKNDPKIAREPFKSHPDMLLREEDISAFVANWEDKPSNLKRIAAELNIGLDSLVFVDDNPLERDLVRRTLPEVSVPEIGDDPALFVSRLSEAGYFEAVSLTAEDLDRTEKYNENARRKELETRSTDLPSFLQSLDMDMTAVSFDAVGSPRILQLINRSNQFNLTTRRHSAEDIKRLGADPQAVTMQVRLRDVYGDLGMIAVLIALPQGKEELRIDTWLMSCRVMGRQVENECLNILARLALEKGFRALIGEYIPTAKNNPVADHYRKLGFDQIENHMENGTTLWRLDLQRFRPFPTFIRVERAEG